MRLGDKALQTGTENLLARGAPREGPWVHGWSPALGIDRLRARCPDSLISAGYLQARPWWEWPSAGDPADGWWVVPRGRRGAGAARTRGHDGGRCGRGVPVLYGWGSVPGSGAAAAAVGVLLLAKVCRGVTVQQGLEELPRIASPPGHPGPLVCEPALGSGAFAVEAVGQLAAAYLERRRGS
ncbi:hypothetical protein QJS66_14075 [Kocuria rhizophila]|nr:hypothetical protein QJS66_14075 [Kocuria rhizophila]